MGVAADRHVTGDIYRYVKLDGLRRDDIEAPSCGPTRSHLATRGPGADVVSIKLSENDENTVKQDQTCLGLWIYSANALPAYPPHLVCTSRARASSARATPSAANRGSFDHGVRLGFGDMRVRFRSSASAQRARGVGPSARERMPSLNKESRWSRAGSSRRRPSSSCARSNGPACGRNPPPRGRICPARTAPGSAGSSSA